MAKKYTEQELNNCSKEILVTLFLHFTSRIRCMTSLNP